MEHLIDEQYVVKDGKAVLRDKKEVKADFILPLMVHIGFKREAMSNCILVLLLDAI